MIITDDLIEACAKAAANGTHSDIDWASLSRKERLFFKRAARGVLKHLGYTERS